MALSITVRTLQDLGDEVIALEKDDLILKNKILDLARNAYFKNIVAYSVFLNLYEQTIFEMTRNELPNVNYTMFGGYSEAERKVVCFYCDKTPEFDILEYINISPANKKFAQDLTHRDFLGALMNLGIERHMIGDICIVDSIAHLITFKSMSETIINELDMVKHTKVVLQKESADDLKTVNRVEYKKINIPSERLDSIIGSIYNISRSKVNLYIDSGKVFINSKQCFLHSSKVKQGDIITVRGLGRARFLGISSLSKKGRLFAETEIFK